jgi:hypothetical protein
MTALGEKVWRDLKPDAQAFDEVRITTVPRYKQSGLSGDEWRISAKVELLRKGRVIVEKGFRNIETACNLLSAVHALACDDGKGFFGGEGNFCDQEGCAERATVAYRKKANYCREGHRSEQHQTTIRRFCDRHKVRGDCGLDDADAHYEPFEEGNGNAHEGHSGGGTAQDRTE